MFIQTEDTPNPQTMKFLPSMQVVAAPMEFNNEEQAAVSPLAQSLFAIDGVQSVFLGQDFISVTCVEGQDWSLLRPSVLQAIINHFMSDRPVLNEGGALSTSTATTESSGDVESQIRDLLDKRVRPAVAQDGGDVVFEKYEDGVVYLRLRGACAGCPSATATLKFGIEQMLRHFIPEVQEVRRVG
ncbi:MAG: NifU family protein [Proteobacteria bacterium]|nr:NifU family protein [Alphaproteobacteria bacterium]NCC03782.1 NifU family protein [Pseudomonadota bacterium]